MVGDAPGGVGDGGRFGADRTGLSAAEGPLRRPADAGHGAGHLSAIINDTDCFTTDRRLHAAVRRRARLRPLRRSRLSRLLGSKVYRGRLSAGAGTAGDSFRRLDRRHPRTARPGVPGAARQSRLCAVARHRQVQVPAVACSACRPSSPASPAPSMRRISGGGSDVFSISLLLFLLSMIVVGGIGSIWGPLLGAALLMLADEALKELRTGARSAWGWCCRSAWCCCRAA